MFTWHFDRDRGQPHTGEQEISASAGLYDSIPLPPLSAAPVDYANERLLWDAAFRQV